MFLINGLPTVVLNGQSPIELLLHKQLNIHELRTFGCACYPYLRPYNDQKFQFKIVKCVYLGPSPLHKGHKCLHPNGNILISRHVQFNEIDFSFSSGFGAPQETTTALSSDAPNLDLLSSLLHQPISPQSPAPAQLISPQNAPNPSSMPLPTLLDHPNITHSNSLSQPTNPSLDAQPNLCPSSSPTSTPPLTPLSSPTRNPPAISPAHLSSSSLSDTPSSPLSPSLPLPSPPPILLPTHPMTTRAKAEIFKPNVLLSSTPRDWTLIEPLRVSDALSTSVWKQAMDLEYTTLVSNNTWHLVPFHSSMNVVGSKWVFRIKRNSDGSVSDIRLVWWPRVFIKLLGWISLILSAQLSSRQQFEWFYLLLSLDAGIFANLTLTTLFLMAPSTKLSICLNHLGMLTLAFLIMSAS